MSDYNNHIKTDADKLLNVYSVFRIALSAVLSLMYLADIAREVLGTANGDGFIITASSYFILAVATHIVLFKASSNPTSKFLIFFTDIGTLILLTSFSGGVESGLGYLLLIPVAAGGIVLNSQLSFLLAALAAIGLLTLTLIGFPSEQTGTASIFSAGLLGSLLFITASLFLYLSKKIKTTQLLADFSAAEAAELQLLNESIIKRMRTGIIVVGSDDRIKLINSAAIQLSGKQSEKRVLGAGQNINVLTELAKQLERWKAYPWLRTPPFKISPSATEIQANFAKLSTGENQQTLIFLEDVRTLSQHAQQLKLSALGRLTGSIAHEIRNPLGAISHAAQLLNESDANTAEKQLTDIIFRHSERVNQIVNNILRLSSQSTPEFQKLWLQQWLKKFHHEFLDSHQESCEIEIEHLNGEFQVTFDATHLSQILTNLVDNGLRYSEKKATQRWVKITTGIDNTDLPYIKITDKGDGVPKEIQEQIFEPFFTTNHDGSGLGLYLSRELCTTNFATLTYVQTSPNNQHFELGFAHPEQLLPRNN